MQLPFRIKVCGITSVEDALLAVESGVDAIGLNFVASSPRCISRDVANQICRAVRSQCRMIGVVANTTPEEACRLASECSLDYLQLHGSESPEGFIPFSEIPIIRSVAWQGGGAGETEIVASWSALSNLAAFLVDAHDPVQLGGTGRTVSWGSVVSRSDIFGSTPWILAGGLTPRNVRQAIQEARPLAVDTASGVELSPGRKNPAAMQEFVREARRGWDSNP